MMRSLFIFCLLATSLFAAEEPAPFEILDGDRVLFLGDTLLEREGNFGYLETRMVEAFPDRKFTVRNLAYSADNPVGWSRAVFDPKEKGFERLKDSIKHINPTVVFLGYGMASSLEALYGNDDPVRYGQMPRGDAAVPVFKQQLGALMDAIQEISGKEKPVRFVLLSPIQHEDLRGTRPGLPDPKHHNELLAKFTKAIEELAKEKQSQYVFLDLSGKKTDGTVVNSSFNLTDNGIHLSPTNGQPMFARLVTEGLGWDKGNLGWNQADSLRQAIVRKNELFFNQWRPQNQTYLFGFRKHEQGKNAADIPKFDPLIAEAEANIEKAKKDPNFKVAVVESPVPIELNQKLPEFTVGDGLEITLWATNPLLAKPIQMNWDAQGRLWIASSAIYPQIEPGAPADDKIIILEDTDRDGKADKSTVFASDLLVPTGVEPDNQGGCYVGQSTELLHLQDTDGDGKYDKERVVLSGFGTEDTHHIIHTLHWGPDGRLYFNQSIYIHSHIETPWGVVRLNSGGCMAWDPRTERVEVVFRGWCNPWGHQFDQYGQSFFTDGAGSEGISWAVPGAMYPTYEGAKKIMRSISPGSYPKYCGLEIMYSSYFPEDWQGNFITNDFRAHRVVRFGVTDLSVGENPKAGYVTKEMPDLVRTDDASFRPIDVKLGPDGALYIADWSNPVINHGEVDFRDKRRDRTMGRIWRIGMKGKAPLKWTAQDKAKAVELVDTAIIKKDSSDLWKREQATQLLSKDQSGKVMGEILSVLPLPATSPAGQAQWSASMDMLGTAIQGPRLVTMERAASMPLTLLSTSQFSNLSTPELAGWVHRLNAQTKAAESELKFKDEKLNTSRKDLVSVLSAAAKHPNPRVRLEAMRALAKIPTTESVSLILEAAVPMSKDGKPMPPDEKEDTHFAYAAWLSMNDVAEVWTTAIKSGEWKPDTAAHQAQLAWGLSVIPAHLVGPVLSEIVSKQPIPKEGGMLIELIARSGGPNELDKLYESMGGLSESAAIQAYKAMAHAASSRNSKPSKVVSADSLIIQSELTSSEKSKAELAAAKLKFAAQYSEQLKGTWNLELVKTAVSQSPFSNVQEAGLEIFRKLGGDSGYQFVSEVLNGLNDTGFKGDALERRRRVLLTLAQIDPAKSVSLIWPQLEKLQASEPHLLAAWRELFSDEAVKNTIAANLPKELPKPIAAAGLRAARELGNKGDALVAALAPLAGEVMPTEAKVDYMALAEAAKKSGDPALGERVYRKPELACMVCHAIGGAGGKVGPEFSSLGASAPLDYIIESIIAPAAKVKEGYHAVNLSLKDSNSVSGVIVRETDQDMIVRDAAGAEKAVAKSAIVKKDDIGSIMPPGLINSLSDADKNHLYAFLGQIGRPGPYDASKGSVARQWRFFSGDTIDRHISGGLIDWNTGTAGLTLVDGRLPKDILENIVAVVPGALQGGGTVVAIAKFQTTTAGKTKLNLQGITKAWLDGTPLAIASEPSPTLELPVGVHTLVVKLDMKGLPPVLRAEAPEARFLTE